MPTIEEVLDQSFAIALEQVYGTPHACDVCVEGKCPTCGGAGRIIDLEQIGPTDLAVLVLTRLHAMSSTPMTSRIHDRQGLGLLNALMIGDDDDPMPNMLCTTCLGSKACTACNGAAVVTPEPDPYSDDAITAMWSFAMNVIAARIDQNDFDGARRVCGWANRYAASGLEARCVALEDAQQTEPPPSNALTPDELAALGID